MTRQIQVEESLFARSLALRKGLEQEKCYIPEDAMLEAFHFGYEKEGKIVATASFYPVALAGEAGKGYQLRLMGVIPALQGQGIGKVVLEKGIEKLKSAQLCDYLWCNARVVALAFYEKLGFEVISEAFEIPEIGTHFRMLYRINPI